MEMGRETYCGRRCDQLEQINADRTETWINGEHRVRVVYDIDRATCKKCVGGKAQHEAQQ
jgi:hypothetical protein